MHVASNIKSAIAGGAFVIALFLACSDSPMMRVDAGIDAALAACNCPAAEQPLAGRIIHRFHTGLWDKNGGFANASCQTVAGQGVLLGGKCAFVETKNASNPISFHPRIRSSGYCFTGNPPEHKTDDRYCCQIDSAAANDTDDSSGFVTAVAICLFPPGVNPEPSPPPPVIP